MVEGRRWKSINLKRYRPSGFVLAWTCVVVLLVACSTMRRRLVYGGGTSQTQMREVEGQASDPNLQITSSMSISKNSHPISDWRQVFPDTQVFRRPMPVQQALAMAYLQERVGLANRKCLEGWRPADVTLFPKVNLYHDVMRRMVACPVAKVGSTFWRRIFAFLTRHRKMSKLEIPDPFHISKILVHTGALGPALIDMWEGVRSSVLTNRTLKFLFARNPYSRLWSVYLDKFYLLGGWEGVGRSDKWCQDFDSFDLFLETALKSHDHHVLPVSDTCDPCRFRPHVIGDMETFGADVEFILNQTGYRYLIQRMSHSHQYQIEVEMNSTITSNFQILEAVRQERGGGVCLNEESLAKRLWRVFQLNGYISHAIDFPTSIADYSVDAMTAVFFEASRNSSMTSAKSRRQREESIWRAFEHVSSRLIRQVQERYRGDFEIFGYDINIPLMNSNYDDVIIS